jgi:hypothetical protein
MVDGHGNRRDFIKGVAAAALFSKTVLGANDRINYAFIGCGGRLDGDLLGSHFLKQPDGRLVAICDCNKTKMDAYQAKLTDTKVDAFVDYRRLLEKKDIDMVVIVTPDHLHSPIMVAALEAGKDVYVEKPVCNSVAGAVAMLKAYRSHKQVVQVGTQQRSWDHFQEAARLVREGAIGTVNHVLVGASSGAPGGGMGMGGGRGPSTTAGSVPPPIPEGLNWDLFLGPAKKVPYDPARLGWRSWFDYGGASISDWGAHWVDIVHLAMETNTSGPTLCHSVSSYPGDPNPDLEKIPGLWAMEFKYPKFQMSLTSFAAPSQEPIQEGPLFLGSRGYLRVNRFGYIVRPYPPNPYALRFATGGGRAGAPGAPGGASGSSGRDSQTPFEEKSYVLSLDDNIARQRIAEGIHIRNFFDCIKSRQKPTAEFEVGFHSSLPAMLGIDSVKQGKSLIWDEATLTARSA